MSKARKIGAGNKHGHPRQQGLSFSGLASTTGANTALRNHIKRHTGGTLNVHMPVVCHNQLSRIGRAGAGNGSARSLGDGAGKCS